MIDQGYKDMFEAFRNNVFCRYERNQQVARNLWEDLKEFVPEGDRRSFEIEWGHYVLEKFGPETFGLHFNKIKSNFN